jgi:maltokinase
VREESERVLGTLPGGAAVAPISGRSDDIREILDGLTAAGSVGSLIRTHGDLHLGQLLWSHGDWIVIDFEGEPARPLPERRLKQSPLRDVAGMLRSFAYAIATVDLVEPGTESRMRDAFLDSYFTAVRSSAILPDQAVVERSLRIFELEKALYELRYELANRPDWVPVPVRGIVRLLEGRT